MFKKLLFVLPVLFVATSWKVVEESTHSNKNKVELRHAEEGSSKEWSEHSKEHEEYWRERREYLRKKYGKDYHHSGDYDYHHCH